MDINLGVQVFLCKRSPAGNCHIAGSDDDRRKEVAPKELLDSLLADYRKPEDLIGENGWLKQLTKLLVENNRGQTTVYFPALNN